VQNDPNTPDFSHSDLLEAETLDEVGFGIPEEPVEEPEDDNPWVAFIRKYRHDPVRFVREVLGTEPFEWQQEALTKISGPKPVRRLSIRSGHGVGKSCTASFAAVHKLATCYPVKIIVTAPSASTLESGLLPEIKSWIKRLPEWLQCQYEVKSDRIILSKDPDAAFLQARTSSKDTPEALAGIHSDNVLIICDEASGIPEAVFNAAQGSMSSEGSQTLLLGNPTKLTGLFYRSHNELRKHAANPDGIWDTMHVSCLTVPEKVSDEFVKEVKEAEGEDSNEYRIRVLGEFPTTENNALISAELVESAMERDIAIDPAEPIVYGLDPARTGGDRAVLCKRQGNVILGFSVWRNLDLMQLVGHVDHQAKQDRPAEIVVDVIGLGAGVADRLRQMGWNVRDCNVSESSALNPTANKLRDELWLSLRDWLRERGCKLPEDRVLREEICAPTYTYTGTGKLVIESKDSMRKRLRRSPDMADALCMTFAGMAAGIGGRATKWVPGEALVRAVHRPSQRASTARRGLTRR
jgi:hypothetical protein